VVAEEVMFDYEGLYKTKFSDKVYTHLYGDSYKGLTQNLVNYYRNKLQDVHDFFNGVPALHSYVTHAKQLLLKIALFASDSVIPAKTLKVKRNVRKILIAWANSNALILDTPFVQKVLGCSMPTARKYVKLIATMFKVDRVCPEFLKGQPAKKYRVTIFELIFSKDLCLRS